MRKVSLIFLGSIAVVLVAFLLLLGALSPRLTSYVQSDSFRTELEKETAKGLHFPEAHYEPIKRTGRWTAESAGLQAKDGWKAMRSLEAHGIRTKFNPWGVFLRRWQLDYVEIQTGKVAIQVYEPRPTPTPSKPWYTVFFPDRVYLKRVESIEPVNVTWEFRKKPAGFLGTHLLITPYGRDFEYQARGGEMRVDPLAELRLEHTHLLITKTLLTIYNLDLRPKSGASGGIHAEGRAGTREDKSVDFKVALDRMPLAEFLPNEWSAHLRGEVTSRIHWQGENPKLERSRGDAAFRLEHGKLLALPFLQKVAALTGEKELENLRLDESHFDFTWNYPQAELKNLLIEDLGKIRVEGNILVHEKKLGGAIELGVARELLKWLPHPGEVFPREHNGYLWTTVHLSGTIEAPEQDLSPRLVEAIKESPGAALGILFRGIGESLKNIFE
jgi:hypothetical protein